MSRFDFGVGCVGIHSVLEQCVVLQCTQSQVQLLEVRASSGHSTWERTWNTSTSSQFHVCPDDATPGEELHLGVRYAARIGEPSAAWSTVTVRLQTSVEFHRLCRLTETMARLSWIMPPVPKDDVKEILAADSVNEEDPQEMVEVTCTNHAFKDYASDAELLGTIVQQEVVPLSQREINIAGLSPLQLYMVRIRRKHTDRGYGKYAQENVFFMTLAPEEVHVTQVDHQSIRIEKSRLANPEMLENFEAAKKRSGVGMRLLLPYKINDETTAKYVLTAKASWEDNKHLQIHKKEELQQINQVVDVSKMGSALMSGDADTDEMDEVGRPVSNADRNASARRKAEVSTIVAFQEARRERLERELAQSSILDTQRDLHRRWATHTLEHLSPDTVFQIEVEVHHVSGEVSTVAKMETRTKQDPLKLAQEASDTGEHGPLGSFKSMRAASLASFGTSTSAATFSAANIVDTNFMKVLLSLNVCKFLTIERVSEDSVTISWSPVDFEKLSDKVVELDGLEEGTPEYHELHESLEDDKHVCDLAEELKSRRIRLEYHLELRPVEMRAAATDSDPPAAGAAHDDAHGKSLGHSSNESVVMSAGSFDPSSPLTTLKRKSSKFSKLSSRLRKAVGGIVSVFLSGKAFPPPGSETPVQQLRGPTARTERVRTLKQHTTILRLKPNTTYELCMRVFNAVDDVWGESSGITRFTTIDEPVVEVTGFPKTVELRQSATVKISESLLVQQELAHRVRCRDPSALMPRHGFSHIANCIVEVIVIRLAETVPGAEGKSPAGAVITTGGITGTTVTVRRVALKEAQQGLTFKSLEPNAIYGFVARKIIPSALPAFLQQDIDDAKEDPDFIKFGGSSNTELRCAFGAPAFAAMKCAPITITDVTAEQMTINVNLLDADAKMVAGESPVEGPLAAHMLILQGGSAAPIKQPLSEGTKMVVPVSHEDRLVSQAMVQRSFQSEISVRQWMRDRWVAAQATISIASQVNFLPYAICDNSFEFFVSFSVADAMDLDLTRPTVNAVEHEAKYRKCCVLLRKHLHYLNNRDHEDMTLEKMTVEVELTSYARSDPKDPDSPFEVVSVQHNRMTCTRESMCVPNLTPGTTYSIRMRPLMSSGDDGREDSGSSFGLWSKTTQFTTPQRIELNLEQVDESSMSLMWHRPSPFGASLQSLAAQPSSFKDPLSTLFGDDKDDLSLFLHRYLLFGKYRLVWRPLQKQDRRRRSSISNSMEDNDWDETLLQGARQYLNGLQPNCSYLVKVQQVLPSSEESSGRSQPRERKVSFAPEDANEASVLNHSALPPPIHPVERRMAWCSNALCARTVGELEMNVQSDPESARCILNVIRPGLDNIELPFKEDEDGTPIRPVEGRNTKVHLIQVRMLANFEGSFPPNMEEIDDPEPFQKNSVDGGTYWSRYQDSGDLPWFEHPHVTPVHTDNINVTAVEAAPTGFIYLNLLPNSTGRYMVTGFHAAASYAFQLRSKQTEEGAMSSWTQPKCIVTRSETSIQMKDASEFSAIVEWFMPKESSFIPIGTPHLCGFEVEVFGYFLSTRKEMTAAREGDSFMFDSAGRPYRYQSQTFSKPYPPPKGEPACSMGIPNLMPGAVYGAGVRSVYSGDGGCGPTSHLCFFAAIDPLNIHLEHIGQRHAILQVKRTIASQSHMAGSGDKKVSPLDSTPQSLCRDAKPLRFRFIGGRVRTLARVQLAGDQTPEIQRSAVTDKMFDFKFHEVFATKEQQQRNLTDMLHKDKSAKPEERGAKIFCARLGTAEDASGPHFFLVQNLEESRCYGVATRSVVEGETAGVFTSATDWSKHTYFATLGPLHVTVDFTGETAVGLSVRKTRNPHVRKGFFASYAVDTDISERCAEEAFEFSLIGDEDPTAGGSFTELMLNFSARKLLVKKLQSGCSYVLRYRPIVPTHIFDHTSAPMKLGDAWYAASVLNTAPHEVALPTLYECNNGFLSFFWNYSKYTARESAQLVHQARSNDSSDGVAIFSTSETVSEELPELHSAMSSRHINCICVLPQDSAESDLISDEGIWDVVMWCHDDYVHQEYETLNVKFVVDAAPIAALNEDTVRVGSFSEVGTVDSSFVRLRLPPTTKGDVARRVKSLAFRVKATVVTSSGLSKVESGWSSWFSFAPPAPLSPPTELQVSGMGPTAKLRWLAPEGWEAHNQVMYVVEVCRVSCGNEFRVMATVKTLRSCILHPLCLKEKYKVRVRALSSFGSGGRTKHLMFSTFGSHQLDGPRLADDISEVQEGETAAALVTPQEAAFPFPCSTTVDATPPPHDTPFHASSGKYMAMGLDVLRMREDIHHQAALGATILSTFGTVGSTSLSFATTPVAKSLVPAPPSAKPKHKNAQPLPSPPAVTLKMPRKPQPEDQNASRAPRRW